MTKKIIIALLIIIALGAIFWRFTTTQQTQEPDAFLVYAQAGVYGPSTGTQTIKGDLTIKAADTTLQNKHITGNLYLEDIKGGTVDLKQIVVEGQLTVIGGEEATIIIQNSQLASLNTTANPEAMQIIVHRNSTITQAHLQGEALLQAENTVHSVVIEGTKEVSLQGIFPAVKTYTPSAQLKLISGTIDHLIVEETASDTYLDISESAIIELLELHAPTYFAGNGTFGRVVNNEYLNVKVPGEYINEEGEASEKGAPVIIYAVNVPTIMLNDSVTVNVSSSPSDAEYSVYAQNSAIARPSIAGNSLTIEGLSPGTTKITLSASHPEHSDASISISVTVVAPTVSSPTASPASGEVAAGTEISLSTQTQGAAIYYTLDGSAPSTNSLRYDSASKPIITADTTLKAIAVLQGMNDSQVSSWTYTLTPPPPVEDDDDEEPQNDDEHENGDDEENSEN